MKKYALSESIYPQIFLSVTSMANKLKLAKTMVNLLYALIKKINISHLQALTKCSGKYWYKQYSIYEDLTQQRQPLTANQK